FKNTRILKKTLIIMVKIGWLTAQAQRIHRIIVKGNQLIETSLIQDHIQLKSEQLYKASKVREDVRRLFSLGFFDEIEVHTIPVAKSKINVIYALKERSVIHSIEFKGNKNLTEESLKEILTLKEFHFLNFKGLEETFAAIRKKYQEKGYFFITLSYQTIPLQKTKGVKLVIRIKENKRALVKKIQFIGNRNLSTSFLKQYLMTQEQSLLSFFGVSGVYNPELLDRDRQVIEFLYRDKGYLQVRLEKPEISITPDQKGVHISLSITEGPRFKVGEVKFQGPPPITSEMVRDRITLGKNQKYFSMESLRRDIQYITDLYKNKGYAFAQVDPQIFPDTIEENKVHILLKADKENLYRLGRIEISGNYKTRDTVILRQFKMKEGDIYSENEKKRAAALIQRLGFFEKADLQVKKRTQKVADIHVKLTERENMGEFSLAAGYNSQTRWLAKGNLKTDNFQGFGHSFTIQLDLGQFQELLNFHYTNPWLRGSEWSLGVDVFNVGRDSIGSPIGGTFLPTVQGLSYSQLNTGASISLGRSFSDTSSVFLKSTFKWQKVGDGFAFFIRDLPGVKKVYEFLFGKPDPKLLEGYKETFWDDIFPPEQASGFNSSIKGIFQHDKRNDRFRPSGGYYASLSLEYSGLLGDFDYTKALFVVHHYQTLFWNLILKNSLSFGLVASNNKNKQVPFTELFLLGGPGSLKGFRAYSVGKRKYSKKAEDYALRKNLNNKETFAWRPYGGTRMFYYNLELRIPLLKNSYLDGLVFFDMGEANDSLTFNFNKGPEEGFGLRADVGFGVQVQVPLLGPVRLDWGFPLKFHKKYEEQEMEFQLMMGTGF
ncbi:MAG: outer membrane protein assembly factor BamA, partial [Bdellovibrionales bacterium]|nr:outer membrane protein assembly factor BamA [Bdellovibrionales bacterium]